MPIDAVVIGAGGFGREALDVIEAHNAAHPGQVVRVIGIVDDSPSQASLFRLADRGYRHLGTIAEAIAAGHAGRYVLGIGSPSVKAAIDDCLTAAGWRPVKVAHPAAVVGSRTVVGEGVIICAGVQVSTNVNLGRHVHLNPNATVGHDAVLGDFVSVNPGAVISGEVRVGFGALIGAGSVVLQQLAVGADSTIGAGSVVTKTVPDHVVVKGVPGVWE